MFQNTLKQKIKSKKLSPQINANKNKSFCVVRRWRTKKH